MIKAFLQKKGIDISCYESSKNQIEPKDHPKGTCNFETNTNGLNNLVILSSATCKCTIESLRKTLKHRI